MAMLPLFQAAEARAALEKLLPQALEASAWGRRDVNGSDNSLLCLCSR